MYCQSCGNKAPEGANNCPTCGAPLNAKNNSQNVTIINNGNNSRPFLRRRSVGLGIFLTIITCGLYLYYWAIVLTDESNFLADKEKSSSGGVTLLLMIVTCGIYTLYWFYKMGKKLAEIGRLNNTAQSDNSVLYLILGVFGLGIINYALIQNELNKYAN